MDQFAVISVIMILLGGLFPEIYKTEASIKALAKSDGSHTGRPHHFVEHQWKSLSEYIHKNRSGDAKSFINTYQIRIFTKMAMRPEYHNKAFHKTCNDRSRKSI